MVSSQERIIKAASNGISNEQVLFTLHLIHGSFSLKIRKNYEKKILIININLMLLLILFGHSFCNFDSELYPFVNDTKIYRKQSQK